MKLFSAEPLQWRGPLAGRYWASVALVLCALSPFLVLSAAVTPLTALIHAHVHISASQMSLGDGLANAAYCFGTILAVQLTARLPAMRLLALYTVIFTLASVLVAAATSPVPFIVGRIIQGLSTSLMLITAAPALVLRYPTARMKETAVVMNMGIFGAVALGPVIGGAFNSAGAWRLLFWLAVAVGVVAIVLAVATFDDIGPADRELEFDHESLALASIGCSAAFFGVANLTNHPFVSLIVLAPVAVGVVCIVGLLVHQTFVSDPLIPVRELVHTIPVAAITLAMSAGAGAVSLMALLQLSASAHHLSTGLFWPEFIAAVITAILFGRLFFTKYIPVLAFSGLLLLLISGVLMVVASDGSAVMTAITAGTIGLGVGASVSPALFVAGFSLPSPQLPWIFALIEMLRGIAAFISAPILIHLATNTHSGLRSGLHLASWTTATLQALGILAVAGIALSGGMRLQKPNIEPWQRGEGRAVESLPLGALLARRAGRRRPTPAADAE